MINCYFEDGKQVFLRHVTVDALVIKSNKILLVKRGENSYREKGKLAIPGGFFDLNETLEEAVKRELQEETGYEAKNVKFFKYQDSPNRRNVPTQDVDFVFVVEVGEKMGESDQEVSSVNWYDLNNLPPEEEFAFDHLEIIKSYIKSQNLTQ